MQANVALRGVQPQVRLAILPPTIRPSPLADYLRRSALSGQVADGARSALGTRCAQPLTIMIGRRIGAAHRVREHREPAARDAPRRDGTSSACGSPWARHARDSHASC